MLFEVVWESLAHSARRRGHAQPLVATTGLALIGGASGLLSLWIVPRRIMPPSRLPGASLVVSPLVTGLLMHEYGKFRQRRHRPTTHLATFWGGATFAFFMALVRFLAYGDWW